MALERNSQHQRKQNICRTAHGPPFLEAEVHATAIALTAVESVEVDACWSGHY